MIIKVGLGQTPSGKILDRHTHWYSYNKRGKYLIDEREDAIQDAIERNRTNQIFVSISNQAYRKVTIEQLRNM